MKWTSSKPKKEGWYWYRQNEMATPMVSKMRTQGAALQTQSGEFWITIPVTNGQWSDSPIPQPED